MVIKYKYIILGAGISGLSFAYFKKGKNTLIIEKSPTIPNLMSFGVHYFHKIPLLPIADYKKKTIVNMAISNKILTKITPHAKKKYSQKIYQMIKKTSIDELDKIGWVPIPNWENFIFELSSKAGTILTKKEVKNIDYQNKIVQGDDFEYKYEYLISTIPLPFLLNAIGWNDNITENYKLKKMFFYNYKLNKKFDNIYIFFVIDASPIARISITDNICNIESLNELSHEHIHKIKNILRYFELENEINRNSMFTKFLPFDEEVRNIDLKILKKHSIFPLGRYAEWRPKLMMHQAIAKAKLLSLEI